ncbi:thymosin beta-10-like protein [Cricetulus griseus]|uniref:Thymosin beta-10 n=1 Tax=Cricetulus griseus TaxID=10029 RepID=A0A061IG35_CRIGR|nr:thymosin beta-10-like protein [Cricetulus griseus]
MALEREEARRTMIISVIVEVECLQGCESAMHRGTSHRVGMHMYAYTDAELINQGEWEHLEHELRTRPLGLLENGKQAANKLDLEEIASFDKAKLKKTETQENTLLTKETIEQKKRSEIS